MKLGDKSLPNSYVAFLIERLTGLRLQASVVDTLTAVCFVLALAASICSNFRDWKNAKALQLQEKSAAAEKI